MPSANDRIVFTGSLIFGVAAAATGRSEVLLAGAAGLVAGSMLMTASEYVSVSSLADTEAADLARERAESANDAEFERRELAAVYQRSGTGPTTADKVADQLMAKDALGAHAHHE